MLKGIIPDSSQLTKKAIMTALVVPEGVIMLSIAVFLDGLGLLFFILNFFGVGLPASFLLSIMGAITVGSWATTRSFFRGVIEKSIENISEKTLNIGGGLEDQKQFLGSSSPAVESGKKIAKKGIKLSLTVVRFIIAFIIKLIPFLNNIFPAWTFLVIFELVEGEI